MNAQNPTEIPEEIEVCTIDEFSANVLTIVEAAKLVFITRHGRFIAAYIPIELEPIRELIETNLKRRNSIAEPAGSALKPSLKETTDEL